MMKTLKLVTLVALFSLSSAMVFSMDEELDVNDPAEKARKAHELASSDMIYQQEEWKALYYQNQQIIALLKDMRDSLQAIRAKQEKDVARQ